MLIATPTNKASLQVWNVGSIIRIAIRHRDASGNLVITDMSGATTMNILLKAPSGEVKTNAASFTTDGTDGEIQWATDSALYVVKTPIGTWQVSAYIQIPGWSGQTQFGRLEVGAILA